MSETKFGYTPLAVHDEFCSLVSDLITSSSSFQRATRFPGDTIDPNLSGLFSFRSTYLSQEVMSKFTDKGTTSPETRRERAIDKWLATEARNQKTNFRILTRRTTFGSHRISSVQVLNCASRFIRRVIGSVPPTHVQGSFTEGASTSTNRSPGAAAKKYTQQVHVTKEARLRVYPILLGNAVGWFLPYLRANSPKVVRGNVMFTVPKNTEIDRVACKEPDLNLWCQKAYGNVIRNRLKRVGIDLNDQTNNQLLSKVGSETGGYATIDLSSASDSVTRALVARLLPRAWYDILDSLRSHITVIDGVEHRNWMFSSMGNGFTFELESLIFWALAKSVAFLTNSRGRLLVYGDDIIVPTEMSRTLVQVLGFCGFLANSKKTFSEGPFRESCGAHWYMGSDVKPFYVRARILTIPDLIRALNQMRKWILTHDDICLENGLEPGLDNIRSKWYRLARRYVDRRLWGGRDLDRTDILVTRHQPGSHRICIVNRHLTSLEEELMPGLLWQTLADGSPSVTITSSSLSRSSPKRLVIPSGITMRKRAYDYWASVSTKPTW